jgi:hypothetical protein
VNTVHYSNQVSLLTFATSSYDRELNANPEDRQRRLSCETSNAPRKFLKSKLSGFDSLNSGDGLKIREHRRVSGEEMNKSPMVLGPEVAGIGK